MGLLTNGGLQALPSIIRLGWRQMAMYNTLSYYSTELITTVKSFCRTGPGLIGRLALKTIPLMRPSSVPGFEIRFKIIRTVLKSSRDYSDNVLAVDSIAT